MEVRANPAIECWGSTYEVKAPWCEATFTIGAAEHAALLLHQQVPHRHETGQARWKHDNKRYPCRVLWTEPGGEKVWVKWLTGGTSSLIAAGEFERDRPGKGDCASGTFAAMACSSPVGGCGDPKCAVCGAVAACLTPTLPGL